MDSWPPTFELSSQGKRKTKSTQAVQHAGPVVHPGSITAANLQRKKDGRLKWTFLSEYQSGSKLSVLDTVTILPPTSTAVHAPSSMGTRRHAEQGAQFLRTYYPDIDITAELIREELQTDAQHTAGLLRHDPLAGNLLASFTTNTRRPSTYVAFPSGDTNTDLVISSIRCGTRNTGVPMLTPQPVCSTETPIKQLLAFDTASSEYDALLAARTLGCVKLLGLTKQGSRFIAVDIVTVDRLDTGDHPAVDVTFSHSAQHPKLLVVNDNGAVYRVSEEEKLRVYQSQGATVEGIWQVKPTIEEGGALLLSGREVGLLDFRIEDRCTSLLADLPSGELYYSMEEISDDQILRVVSTSEVIWTDIRFPRKPLLAVKHARRFDSTLRLKTLMFAKRPITLLTSDIHRLASIYDASSDSTGLMHLHTPEYLVQPSGFSSRRTGHLFIQPQPQADDLSAWMVELSDQHSIHCTGITMSDEPSSSQARGVRRSAIPQQPVESTASVPNMLEQRRHSKVDFALAYTMIFDINDTRAEAGQAAYDTLDFMRTFWRNNDTNVEHMVTGFDVAFRAGLEPDEAFRADFLAGSSLNNKRGYRAMMQGNIPLDAVSSQAPWSYRVSRALQRLDPGYGETAEQFLSHAGQHSLLVDDYRPGLSIRRETEATEQLALDLFLASHVASPRAVQTSPQDQDQDALDEAFETMSLAPSAAQLVPEPPPVQFGFLQLTPRGDTDHYDKEELATGLSDSKHLCPLGVRLLLQDWTIGEDPAAYTYEDPYDVDVPPAVQLRRNMRSPPPRPTAPPLHAPPTIAPSQPRRPPALVKANTMNEHMPPPSQPVASRGMTVQGRSQGQSQTQTQGAPMSSTQILPGPFGGRPVPVKKKTVKKRMGGF